MAAKKKTKAKTSRLGGNTPSTAVLEAEETVVSSSPRGRGVRKERTSVFIEVGILERLRWAAFWEHAHITEIINSSLREKLDRMEHERGQPYEPPPERRASV